MFRDELDIQKFIQGYRMLGVCSLTPHLHLHIAKAGGGGVPQGLGLGSAQIRVRVGLGPSARFPRS